MTAWEKFFLLMFIAWMASVVIGAVGHVETADMLSRMAWAIANAAGFMLSGKKRA